MATVKKNTEAPKAEVKKPAPALKAVAKAAPAKSAEPATEAPARVGRKQLAQLICDRVKETGKAIPFSIAEIVVVAYEEAVGQSLAAGNEVNLPGFGKFIVTDKEEAQKRNPSNGEMVTVAAHKAVRFKVGAGLKKAVNGGAEAADE